MANMKEVTIVFLGCGARNGWSGYLPNNCPCKEHSLTIKYTQYSIGRKFHRELNVASQGGADDRRQRAFTSDQKAPFKIGRPGGKAKTAPEIWTSF
jgi:hypothetical protein